MTRGSGKRCLTCNSCNAEQLHKSLWIGACVRAMVDTLNINSRSNVDQYIRLRRELASDINERRRPTSSSNADVIVIDILRRELASSSSTSHPRPDVTLVDFSARSRTILAANIFSEHWRRCRWSAPAIPDVIVGDISVETRCSILFPSSTSLTFLVADFSADDLRQSSAQKNENWRHIVINVSMREQLTSSSSTAAAELSWGHCTLESTRSCLEAAANQS